MRFISFQAIAHRYYRGAWPLFPHLESTLEIHGESGEAGPLILGTVWESKLAGSALRPYPRSQVVQSGSPLPVVDETAERGREDVAIKLQANGPTSALSCLNRPILSFSWGDSCRFNLPVQPAAGGLPGTRLGTYHAEHPALRPSDALLQEVLNRGALRDYPS